MVDAPRRSSPIARARLGSGEEVVLTPSAWEHIVLEHPEMAPHADAVMSTASQPEVVADDPRPGRLRHYRSAIGPSRWLRVVVDFNQSPAQIVTAHAHRKEPPR